MTELSLQPASKTGLPDAGKQWQGPAPTFHVVRWKGGVMAIRPYPHEPRGAMSKPGAARFGREFQKAIARSVTPEKQDGKSARRD